MRSPIVEALIRQSLAPRRPPRSAVEGLGQAGSSLLEALAARKIDKKDRAEAEEEKQAFLDTIDSLGIFADTNLPTTQGIETNSRLLEAVMQKPETGGLNLGQEATDVLSGASSARNAAANLPNGGELQGFYSPVGLSQQQFQTIKSVAPVLADSPQGRGALISAIMGPSFSQNEPIETFSVLSNEEEAAMGLDPNSSFRRSNLTGKVERIGGGDTNINLPGTPEDPNPFDAVEKDVFQENFKNLNSQVQLSRQQRPKLRQARELLQKDTFDSGGLEPLFLRGKQIGQSLGFNFEGLSDQESFNALAISLNIDVLQRLTGPKTDFEFEKTGERIPNLSKSRQGNLLIIEGMELAMDAKEEELKATREFWRDAGGFNPALAGDADEFVRDRVDNILSDRLNDLNGRINNFLENDPANIIVGEHPEYGEISEADIQAMMKANNMSRKDVLKNLGFKDGG